MAPNRTPRSRAAAWLGACCTIPLLACVVPTAPHPAEGARMRALEHARDQREQEVQRRRAKVRQLQSKGRDLKLEREALSEERVRLLGDLEQLREGNLTLEDALADERAVREAHEREIAELSGTYGSLVEELEREVEAGKIEIHRLKGRLQVRALDKILFDSGQTVIKPEGQQVLASVAAELVKLKGHRIEVQGHTDNVPIQTARFPSNWELSAARAVTVLRFLTDQGLQPELLSAGGLGEFQPIEDNGSARGRARNRRIELVLLPDDDG